MIISGVIMVAEDEHRGPVDMTIVLYFYLTQARKLFDVLWLLAYPCH